MSTNFNTPSGLEGDVSTETAKITPLPLERKQELVQQTQDKLKLLTKDMQKISHADFLNKVEHADRLKHLTDPNIDASEISENTKIEFNFSFTSEKENRNLYILTTAGQVLPSSVSDVTTNDGKQYSRKSSSGEFFASDGKRLIIRDKTQITIGELRDDGDLDEIKIRDTKKLENTNITVANKELITMGASKGIDPELILKSLSGYFGTESFEEIDENKYEDFLTQFDREIGYMNMDEKTVDKNNLTEKNKEELADRMGKQTSMESLNHNQKSFPELNALASKLSVNPEMLHAIWSNESTYSFGQLVIPEPGARTSYGYFSILGTQYKELGFSSQREMGLALNHPDQEIRNKNNIDTLEKFIYMKPGLLSALQRKDFHKVAYLYNGSNYENMADEGKQYDDKLRRAADNYLAA